jgi:hypothetical protein
VRQNPEQQQHQQEVFSSVEEEELMPTMTEATLACTEWWL